MLRRVAKHSDVSWSVALGIITTVCFVALGCVPTPSVIGYTGAVAPRGVRTRSMGLAAFWGELEERSPDKHTDGLLGYFHRHDARGIGTRSELQVGFNNLQGFVLLRTQLVGSPGEEDAPAPTTRLDVSIEIGASLTPFYDNLRYDGHVGVALSMNMEGITPYACARKHWATHYWPDSGGYVSGEVQQSLYVVGAKLFGPHRRTVLIEGFYSRPDSVDWQDTGAHTSWGVNVVWPM